MSYETLRYDIADTGVATIALDQPDNRNALTDALLSDLLSALQAARDDDAVRCVVLASTHETTFSAGGNLAAFGDDTPIALKHLGTEGFPRVFTAIGELGKPVICAAKGHCLAGALGLAIACDLIVASDKATFGTPEINIGAFPFMILATIYRNVPRKKVTEMLLLGERLSAEEALQYGIVNKVVPVADFDAAVEEWAVKLAGKSPLIMKLGKDAMWRSKDMGLEDQWDFLRSQLTIAFATEDLKEGVAAFFEKREPDWKGR